MKEVNVLASYVPSMVVSYCVKEATGGEEELPGKQQYETVCVFCDVSGFTALSEAMAESGKGAEGLKKHLNAYFGQMNRIIAGAGGDIFKFAGDAVIVLWPPSPETTETKCRRAADAAIQIQQSLDRAQLEADVELSVKIGIGVGLVTVLHVGGVQGRREYVAVGDPLVQAFNAEHHATRGDVICSKDAWRYVKRYYRHTKIDDGFVFLDAFSSPEKKNNDDKRTDFNKSSIAKVLESILDDSGEIGVESQLRAYIPESALPALSSGSSRDDEKWANEMRTVAVVFVNLGVKEADLVAAGRYAEAAQLVHAVLVTAQHSVYRYQGTVNKFLMDDKGATLIACFGLPPTEHSDDVDRAVFASLDLRDALKKDHNLNASIGITFGDVFCGVTGSIGRKEYTVLGDSVNLSARLMQKACQLVDTVNQPCGGVVCDSTVYKNASTGVVFTDLGDIRVKGKAHPIRIYHPYSDSDCSSVSAGVLARQTATRSMSGLLTAVEPVLFRVARSRRRKLLRSARPNKAMFEQRTAALSLSQQEGERPSSVDLNVEIQSRRSRGSTTTTATPPSDGVLFFSDIRRPWSDRPSCASCCLGAQLGCFSISDRCLVALSCRSYRDADPDDAFWLTGRVLRGGETSLQPTDDPPIEPLPEPPLATLADLRDRLFRTAGCAYFPADARPEDFTLRVAATRFSLPDDDDIGIDRLPSYADAAYGWRSSPADDAFERVLPLDLIPKTLDRDAWRLDALRRGLVDLKRKLVDQGIGAVAVIEGQAGSGKTRVLGDFLAKCMPRTAPMVYVAADNLAPTRPLAPWRCVARSLIELWRTQAPGRPTSLSRAARQLLLGDKKDDDDDTLSSAVVDAVFLTERRDIDVDATIPVLTKLFDALARGLRTKPVIVLDDCHHLDPASRRLLETVAAMRLPLLCIVALRPLSPDGDCAPVHPTLRAEPGSEKVRPRLNNGFALPETTVVFKLDRLPPDEFVEAVCDELDGAPTESLVLRVAARSLCLPGLVKAVVAAENIQSDEDVLLERRSRRSLGRDDKGSSSFAEVDDSLLLPGDKKKTDDAVEAATATDFRQSVDSAELAQLLLARGTADDDPPSIAGKFFLEKLNGCSACELLVLKTIAVVGGPVSLPRLRDCYLVADHSDQLDAAVETLVRGGLLVRFDQAEVAVEEKRPRSGREDLTRSIKDRVADGETSAENPAATYVLAHGPLMAAAVVSRMLSDDRRLIRERVGREQARVEDAKMSTFLAKMSAHASAVGEATVFKAGVLTVRRNVDAPKKSHHFSAPRLVQGEFKARYCVVKAEALEMYRSRADHDQGHAPTQTINLAGARVEKEKTLFMENKKTPRFYIEARSYVKAGHLVVEDRRFVLQSHLDGASDASKQDDVDSWVATVKLVIERCKLRATNSSSTSCPEKEEPVVDLAGVHPTAKVGFVDSPLAGVYKAPPLLSSGGALSNRIVFRVACFVGRARDLTNCAVKAPPIRPACAFLVDGRRCAIADASEISRDAAVFDRTWTLDLRPSELGVELNIELRDSRALVTPDRLGATAKIAVRDLAVCCNGNVDEAVAWRALDGGTGGTVEFGAWIRSMRDADTGAELGENAIEIRDALAKSLLDVEDCRRGKVEDAIEPATTERLSSARSSGGGTTTKKTLVTEPSLDEALSEEIRKAIETAGPVWGYATKRRPSMHGHTELPENWWRRWDFDIWQVDSDSSLLRLVDFVLCEKFEGGGDDLLRLRTERRDVWTRFLACVRRLMTGRGNPYHNLRHAVDTALAAYCLAVGLGSESDDAERIRANEARFLAPPGTILDTEKTLTLTRLDLIGLFVAALCHDLDHPGRNNSFLVKTGHRLALRYNDSSVLENWHAFALWSVLARPETDVFAPLPPVERRQLRGQTIAAILATDLTKQADIQRALFSDAASGQGKKIPLICGVLHAADVSNPAKPWPISKAWSDRILDEFFDQGDHEARLGFPISPNMDRAATDQAALSVGFVDFLVSPLYAQLATLHPPIDLCLDQLATNRRTWSDMMRPSSRPSSPSF